jgi:formamidopyrimidine-DNA glycosylase
MPEGPEVACLSEELNKFFKGREVMEMEILGGRYVRKEKPKGWEGFQEMLPAKVEEVEYKGKLIIFHFINQEGEKRWLFNTLGMSGCWTYTRHQHSHLKVSLKKMKGKEGNEIYFTDVRCFGTLIFTDDEKEYQKKIKSIAKGFLGKEEYQISEKEFVDKCKKSCKKNIAIALMDQKSVCSGVGNYLLSEIVFDTGINPFLTFADLEEEDLQNLFECCGRLIRDSYKYGGTSIRNYTNLEGENGDNYYNLKVYGQEVDPEGFEVRKVEGPHKRTLWLSTSYSYVEELKE